MSSLKGHLGHTLGACGAIEAWITIQMLREGWVAPTLNLENVDPRCAELDYVEDLIGSFFALKNPNASSTCGCGTSFSI